MYYEHHRYVGKVCVVTGGANGLGLNLVNRLVEEGAFVAALDLEKETLDKEFAGQEKVFGVPCDVSSKTSVDAAVAAVIEHYGHIDALFNIAGVIGRQSMLDSTEEQWRRVIDINLNGTFFMTQAVCRHMVDKGIKGVVINTSSVASQIVSPNTGAYSASKGGVTMFTKFAALEIDVYKRQQLSLVSSCPLLAILRNFNCSFLDLWGDCNYNGREQVLACFLHRTKKACSEGEIIQNE